MHEFLITLKCLFRILVSSSSRMWMWFLVLCMDFYSIHTAYLYWKAALGLLQIDIDRMLHLQILLRWLSSASVNFRLFFFSFYALCIFELFLNYVTFFTCLFGAAESVRVTCLSFTETSSITRCVSLCLLILKWWGWYRNVYWVLWECLRGVVNYLAYPPPAVFRAGGVSRRS